MNHDVIDDCYGRLFCLPQFLSEHATVTAFCLDYRFRKSSSASLDASVFWHRSSVLNTLFLGWIFSLWNLVRRQKPQVIIASSDCLCVILGYWLARLCGARFVADLYDDYSTFGLASIPGLRFLYERALLGSDGITAVSETLALHLQKEYPGKPVIVLESTINSETFSPMDKQESRSQLGLERYGKDRLVGICGGLNAYHGADIVFSSIPYVADWNHGVSFILAGTCYSECPIPQRSDTHYLGMLPHHQMRHFFNAMDVVVVPLSNTKFGYFAFPQKAYEVLACKVPVAAANVGALGMLFADFPAVRYDPDNPQDLALVITKQLLAPQIVDVDIPNWPKQSIRLFEFLESTILN